MNLDNYLHAKIEELRNWFSLKTGAIIAYSGGIDSSLVIFLSRKFKGKDNTIAVISESESLKRRDLILAKEFCKDFDIQLNIIKTQEMNDRSYNKNPANRCYFCKEHLFKSLLKVKQQYPEFEILTGTNKDDLSDYRPGLQAANYYKISAPMLDCNLNKKDIRNIAKYFQLPNWNKPASPCLSSRIPYDQTITIKKLQQIEDSEDILNQLGFDNVRVRHYGSFAKVEVDITELDNLLEMKEDIILSIREVGFKDVLIDYEGLVSGKLNRTLKTSMGSGVNIK